MTTLGNHNSKNRTISVVVDNDSWIIPSAMGLVEKIKELGNEVYFCREHEEIRIGDIAFFLGCTKIAEAEHLSRNLKNLVVHESDLPKGRGFAPVAWQVLNKENIIPVCLLEIDTDGEVDSGNIIYKGYINLEGHELMPEIRRNQAVITKDLCLRYISEVTLPEGKSQEGMVTYYPRRWPQDSKLDPMLSIAEQFELLRIVDNHDYPAFFE